MLFPCGYTEQLQEKFTLNDANTVLKKTERKYELRNGIPPYDHFGCRTGRASYVTFRGAITVEAAIVVPLVVAAFVLLIQIMVFMNLQLRIQTALYHQAVKAAGYSYLADSVENYLAGDIDTEDYAVVMSIIQNGITEVIVKHMVEGELGEEFFQLPWIKNGSNGLNIIFSTGVRERELDIILQYELKTCFDIFGIGNIPMTARASLEKWSGVTKIKQDNDAADEQDGVVYITKSGSVYHLYRTCTYLSVSLTRVRYSVTASQRNASGGKYYPCSFCVQGVPADDDYMYISKYGECYHADDKCRNIYHNIIEIKTEDIGTRALCSKCRDRRSAD